MVNRKKQERIIRTPEFSDELITTMTLIFEFEGILDLRAVACVLPVTPIKITRTSKRAWATVKPKPHELPPAGCSYAIRYADICRGLFGSPFKNTVMVDMSMGSKSINIKLSKKNVHICGLGSVEMGKTVADMVWGQIQNAQPHLEWMREHSDVMLKLFDWMKKHCAGEEYERPRYEVRKVQVKENKYKLRKIEVGTETVLKYYPFKPENLVDEFPIPLHILQFMENMFAECEAMPDVETRVSHFSGFPIAMKSEIVRLPGYRNVMANCSFNLGFRLKREELCRAINEMNDPEWRAHFNNLIDYSVKIEMVCDKDELAQNNVLVSKKNAVPVCVFVVYASSHVMMSSKYRNGLANDFYKFRELIDKMKNRIEE